MEKKHQNKQKQEETIQLAKLLYTQARSTLVFRLETGSGSLILAT